MEHHRWRRQALTHLVGFPSLVVSLSTVTITRRRLLPLPGHYRSGSRLGRSIATCSLPARRFSSSTHPILNAGYASLSPLRACRTWLRTSIKTTNLVTIHFRKPDLAIRPDRQVPWDGAEMGQGELADLPRRRDAPDLVALGVVGWIFDKPQVAIRSRYDAVDPADMLGHGELTERARRSNTSDPVVPTVEVS